MSELWSAVAATFAALASFFLWRIGRESLRQSVRPELIIREWSRVQHKDGSESVRFAKLQNVGRGPSLHWVANCHKMAENRPIAVMGTMRGSLLASDATADVNGDIHLWWKNVTGNAPQRHISVAIEILCWDTIGLRYLTEYQLFISELHSNVMVSDSIAPNVSLVIRRVKAEPVWWLQLRRWFPRQLNRLSSAIQKVPLSEQLRPWLDWLEERPGRPRRRQ